MKPIALTQLAFLVNFIIGHNAADLPLAQVRTAARRGRLLTLLATRYADVADFYYLTWKPDILRGIESALDSAARSLTWGESRRIGVSQSGLCLAQAIIIQAIQDVFVAGDLARPGRPSRSPRRLGPDSSPSPALPAAWNN